MKKIIILMVALIIIFGFFLYTNNSLKNSPIIRRACTEEAMICPDGTSVGRVGPNCEFEQCPPTQKSTKINLDSLTPATGSTGQKVIIKGTGFTTEDNVVKFGIGYIYNTILVDGSTLEFTIPDGYELCPPKQEMCPDGYPRLQTGTHDIQVLNDNGESNILQFNVN
ncbi:hypothetical protein A2V49_01510 [candidate division WWE3 bacterium RBG_19FT_COMBO_34_6]|uniref:IPT/TIG domain-containing protein n=1 Tax=candidate division WWE3 bacterium RBG_19FT_COMBO_34_6 TaxID=1802612 RepID=A0A1F4UK17_UNCKA|nr:MAG: hypothetical protein A2V49_01510 [candidate division WWE3 bacterium RBG_19FT_COMBO_34_6]